MGTLLIGASGFIGSRVSNELEQAGLSVIPCDLIRSANRGATFVQADVLSLAALERIAFEYRLDNIIHLVGLPAIDYCERNPHFSYQLNVESVQHSLELMRLADIKRIIFASTASVYGDRYSDPVRESDIPSPVSLYGHHKLMAEESIRGYAESYGLEYVILRLFNVFGNEPELGKDIVSVLIRSALAKKPVVLKGPKKFRDFVHVDEVAKGFASALKLSERLTLNFGTGRKTELQDLANLVRESFADLQLIAEQTDDDGTGIYADVSRQKEKLGFIPNQTNVALKKHIARFALNKEADA